MHRTLNENNYQLVWTFQQQTQVQPFPASSQVEWTNLFFLFLNLLTFGVSVWSAWSGSAGTYAGRQDTRCSFVKVKSPHAPHAICYERQDVTARQQSVRNQSNCRLRSAAYCGNSHLSSFQWDDHLVISNKVRLTTIQCDCHFFLNTCTVRTHEHKTLRENVPRVLKKHFNTMVLTQREGRGPVCHRVQRNPVRWNTLVQVQQWIHSKHHHTT